MMMLEQDWLAPPAPGRAAWMGFDHEWYACTYSDAAASGNDFTGLLAYHRTTGEARGHAPNMFFDEAWYRAKNPDVAAAIATGLVASGYAHYCRTGHRDRSPHWLYDDGLYALQCDDLGEDGLRALGCVNAYDHYLRHGAQQGRVAHLLFEPAVYRAALTAEPGTGPAIDRYGAWPHFLRRIWFEQRDARTALYFDPDWFLAQYPAAAARVQSRQASCALHAYLSAVVAEPCNPLPLFDEAFYLATNADAAALVGAGVYRSGYDHFLRAGTFALRQPAPAFDLRHAYDTTPALRMAISAGSSRDAFTYLLGMAADQMCADQMGIGQMGAGQMGAVAARPAAAVHAGGHVDGHGFAAQAEGWLFVGWLPLAADLCCGVVQASARFVEGGFTGTATLAKFVRADVVERGVGVVLFLAAPPPAVAGGLGGLVELEICDGSRLARLPARTGEQALGERQIVAAAAACLADLNDSPEHADLRALLGRKPYAGTNTLDELRDRVFLEIDETVLCPPLVVGGRAGLMLCGWMLAVGGTVAQMRLHSGPRSTVLALEHSVRIDRPDVLEGIGLKQGFADLRSGFLIYADAIVQGDEVPYLAVRTARGEIGYRPLPGPKLRGMEAIRFLLDRAELRYGEVAPAFDAVFGPSVARLNADRLRAPVEFQTIDFGTTPAAPVLSVIVTLFGRLDFMEYQLAFLSRHVGGLSFELIYVLDDPARRRQLENLAASVHARFGIPFRLVLLAHNLGFAPANNVGLGLARGEFVCFMNSDVFPGTADWMEQLVQRLRDTPGLGVVGPLLLFEDGCVQHQGMNFEALPAFAGWHFPMHPGKGWRPQHDSGLHRCLAITGACMVMARDLAEELGGFDPAYAIGDFEDSDLCLRLRTRGLDSAVDAGVRLYHLERQSQAGSHHRWRMNLTLYNAWLHEGRWGALLSAETAPPAAVTVGGAP